MQRLSSPAAGSRGEGMSASERLRVLQASPAYIVRDELERVLPQLAAVVKAAESIGPNPTFVGQQITDAVIALDEALEKR